jgi:hypothetical protein
MFCKNRSVRFMSPKFVFDRKIHTTAKLGISTRVVKVAIFA